MTMAYITSTSNEDITPLDNVNTPQSFDSHKHKLLSKIARSILTTFLLDPNVRTGILADIHAPESKSNRLKNKIALWLTQGFSAYEMRAFEERVILNGGITHQTIAENFGKDRTTVTKWFSQLTIEEQSRLSLFELYSDFFDNWNDISRQSKWIYSLAWTCSSLRKEIFDSCTQNQISPAVIKCNSFDVLDCLYLRIFLGNSDLRKSYRHQDDLSVTQIVNEINRISNTSYKEIIQTHQFPAPCTCDRLHQVINQWWLLFEFVVLQAPKHFQHLQHK
jgi:hypothetical protein